jgi:hypothetical protein
MEMGNRVSSILRRDRRCFALDRYGSNKLDGGFTSGTAGFAFIAADLILVIINSIITFKVAQDAV